MYETTVMEVLTTIQIVEKMADLPIFILVLKDSRQMKLKVDFFKKDFKNGENLSDCLTLAQETQSFMELLHSIPSEPKQQHISNVKLTMEKIQRTLIDMNGKQ